MADEQTALCTRIHIEADRRFDRLETEGAEMEKCIVGLKQDWANVRGMVRGAILVGTISGTVIGTLIGLVLKFALGA